MCIVAEVDCSESGEEGFVRSGDRVICEQVTGKIKMNCSGSSPCDDDVSQGLVEGSWFVTLIMAILSLVWEGRVMCWWRWGRSKSVGLRLVGLGDSGVLTSFPCLPDGLT